MRNTDLVILGLDPRIHTLMPDEELCMMKDNGMDPRIDTSPAVKFVRALSAIEGNRLSGNR